MTIPELESAVELACQLRDAIAAEIEGARRERQLLKSLDSNALFGRAAQRASFLADAARLERALAAALASVTAPLGLPEVTIERLRSRADPRCTALGDALSEVRALASALQEIDKLNLDLARRALVVVRGYVEALQPTPRAYDRYGGRSTAPALAVISSKG
jgi:hypothetical protein